ncbi:hypothetical protein BH24ACT5_BH24ACT5_07340 [soil metagenome]
MSEHLLLDADRIRQHLREVAVELGDAASQSTVILVGGAIMAWHGLRRATRDVDSVNRLDVTLAEAVSRVAERHGLAPRWLNDS